MSFLLSLIVILLRKNIIFSSLLLSLFFINISIKGQSIFWTENFNNGCTLNCLASSYTGSNGAWTVSDIGAQGFAANIWYVSCAENGNGTGNCGSGCGSDATLHIGNPLMSGGDQGATYDFGGGFNNSTTNKRAETPNISTIGKTNITLSFEYIENGQGTTDDGLVYYSTNGGSSWNLLFNLAKTTVCVNTRGLWTQYSTVLPSSCENISNLKIGFLWVNNNDGSGTNPSFAIDNITFSTPAITLPVANFTASSTTICTGQCTNFTDLSSNFPTSWNWFFPGASPSSSTQQYPTSICYNTAGTYNVTLIVSNSNGSDTLTLNNYITVLSTPSVPGSISGLSNVCSGQTNVSYTISAVSGATSYNWTVPTGATIASGQGTTAINVNFGNSSGQVCVTASNVCGTSSLSCISVTVLSTPAAPSTINGLLSVCSGQTNVSYSISAVSGATSYNWTVPTGATIATGQGTTAITVNFGSSSGQVCVTASNVCGTSPLSCSSITVNSCNAPFANFNADSATICAGQCINFTDISSNSPASWNWSFSGASPSSSTQQNPTNICYNTAGAYSVTLIVSNSYGSDTLTQNNYIAVLSTPVAPSGISGLLSVCSGQTNVSYSISAVSGATTYNWTVPMGSTIVSGQGTMAITVNFDSISGQICVTASNQCGTSSPSCDSITVNNCITPSAGFMASSDSICAEQCLSFTDQSSGPPTSWNWSFPGANLSSSAQQNPSDICYSSAGTFAVTLIVSNTFGSDTNTLFITVHPLPVVTVSSDITISSGDTAQLWASGGTGYLWIPATSLNNANISNPLASPIQTTTYTVIITDINGCSQVDSVKITVSETNNNVLIIPQAFSPNGDGLNDFLLVKGKNLKNFWLVIFNRWEEKIFETNDVSNLWDGTFHGKPMNSGIFVYYMNAEFLDGEKISKSGTITLLK